MKTGAIVLLAIAAIVFAAPSQSFALFMRSPRLSDANREIVATALARHAATLARSIQPADRLANAANARAAPPALNAAARTNVETFIAAMSDPGCEALCAIP